MSLGSRIRQLRKRLHLTQEELADKAGVDRGYLSLIETGKRRQPGTDIIRALARALETTPDDLASAMVGAPTTLPAREPIEIARELLTAIERQQAERRQGVPVRKVETLMAAGEGAIPEGEVITYYPRPEEVGHRFLAFDVKGTCMEPVIHDGETATIDLDASPRFNDIVAVYHEGESLIRILRDRFLYSMNDHPPVQIGESTRIVGVVVQVSRRPKVPF